MCIEFNGQNVSLQILFILKHIKECFYFKVSKTLDFRLQLQLLKKWWCSSCINLSVVVECVNLPGIRKEKKRETMLPHDSNPQACSHMPYALRGLRATCLPSDRRNRCTVAWPLANLHMYACTYTAFVVKENCWYENKRTHPQSRLLITPNTKAAAFCATILPFVSIWAILNKKINARDFSQIFIHLLNIWSNQLKCLRGRLQRWLVAGCNLRWVGRRWWSCYFRTRHIHLCRKQKREYREKRN